MSNDITNKANDGMGNDITSLKWDRPVQKKGAVVIPKPILDSLGNPRYIRFEVNAGRVFIRAVKPEEVKET